MIYIHELGQQPYLPVFQNMKQFTEERQAHTADEMWLLTHEPVYTQGQAGKAEHVLQVSDIPMVQADRGGQVTYHGPGQLVAYCMLDLKRRGLSIRDMVCLLETLLIALLAQFNIEGTRLKGAPGVYVNQQKIAAVGLRVKKGCTYHGIALNVDMDLTPFQWIRPCGLSGMTVTQMSHHVPTILFKEVVACFIQQFLFHFES